MYVPLYVVWASGLLVFFAGTVLAGINLELVEKAIKDLRPSSDNKVWFHLNFVKFLSLGLYGLIMIGFMILFAFEVLQNILK